jgi:hypothetical protein
MVGVRTRSGAYLLCVAALVGLSTPVVQADLNLERCYNATGWPERLELRFTLHLHDRGKGVDDSKVLLALGFEGRGRGRSDDAPRG